MNLSLVVSGRINDNYIIGSNRLGADGTNYHIRSYGGGMLDNKFIGNTTERRETGPDVLAAFGATGGGHYVRIGNNWADSQKPGGPSVIDNSGSPVVLGEIT